MYIGAEGVDILTGKRLNIGKSGRQKVKDKRKYSSCHYAFIIYIVAA